jgi:hypothetical protein
LCGRISRLSHALVGAIWASAVMTIDAGVIQRPGPEVCASAAKPQDFLSVFAHIDPVELVLE